MPLIAFGLLLTIAVVGAIWRGGIVERKGAALFVAAWLASLGAQLLTGDVSPGLWLPAIDAAVLVGLANLAWRSPRPWPVYACGFQMLTLAGDIAKWVEADLDVRLQLALLSVLGFGTVGMLVMGAWFPPREQQG